MLSKILLSNVTGLILNIPAFTLNIKAWIFSIDMNEAVTIVISVLAITWWLMKIYDQYYTTKKKKKNEL